MTLPMLPETEEELAKRAEKTLDRQTKSYVEDALMFARWILERGLPTITKIRETCVKTLGEKEALQELTQKLAAEREGSIR